MYIENLKIKNFGPFKSLNLNFNSAKVNIVHGNNATGKTHILAALHFLFYNNDAIRVNKKIESLVQIKATINVDNIDYEIEKRFSNNRAEFVVKNYDDLINFAQNVNRNNLHLISCESLANKETITKNEVKKLVQFINTITIDEDIKADLQERINLDKLQNNMPIAYMSIGQRLLVNLLLCFAKRNDGDVYVCDSILSYFDFKIINCIYNLIDKLENCQIILLSSIIQDNQMNNYDYRYSIHKLPMPSNEINAISCNYKHEFNDDFIFEESVSDTIKITNYFLGHQLDEEECRLIEFKEVKGENPCTSIIKVAENYVVAFLNSTVIKEGTIAWGVNDNRMVVGVLLDYNAKDKIRRELSERFAQITPYISPEMYKVTFKEVYNKDNSIAKDTYIVEVKVKTGNSDFLYATPKGEVYIKTDGGKKKLGVQEIQQELRRRLINR